MEHSWYDAHVQRTLKSFVHNLYITLGVFLFLFVSFHIGGSLYASQLSKTQLSKLETGLAKDFEHLRTEGNAIAQSDELIRLLRTNDTLGLQSFLQSERAKRTIGLMGVTNAEGIMVSRTLSSSVRGDNSFLTAPVGRRVSKGMYAESIEMTSFYDQLFMTTGRPVWDGEEMIGALFANYLTDDVYASRFRDAYLSPGAELVFYSKMYGVYGNSFVDEGTRRLVRSYFNSGSEWVQSGLTSKTIAFDGGTTYLVENVVFPGLEHSPGGVLVFIPRTDISGFANCVTALLTLLVFIVLAFRTHRCTRGEERGWRYVVLLAAVATPVLGLTLFALSAQNSGRLQLHKVDYPLYNSTMYLQPESGVYDIGYERQFSVMVHPGDEPINAVQFGITYDPTLIEVKAVDTASTTCSHVIESYIEPDTGRAGLSCIILEYPSGSNWLRIADIHAVPRKAGIVTLAFDQEETKVLANDSLGTNVLRMSQSGTYQIENFRNTSATVSERATTTSIVLFSPTHPNQGRWYNARTARFVWRGSEDDVYQYAFGSSHDPKFTIENTIEGTEISIPIGADGAYYFHLRRVAGGPVSQYRIQSDRTAPTIYSTKLSADTVVAGDVVRFEFEAEDKGSGIQKNYYVDLGSHLFLPVGTNLFVPFLEAGDQPVTLRVYDDAGNYAEKTSVVHVTHPAGDSPWWTLSDSNR